MAIDPFYHTNWRANAERSVASLPIEDRVVMREMFKKKIAAGVSDRRLEKIARDISIFQRKHLRKPLSKASLEDLEKTFGALFRSDASYYTLQDYAKHVREFLRQLQGDAFNPLRYEFMHGGKAMSKKRAQMLNNHVVYTQEEIRRHADALAAPRDKALQMTLFDVTCRCGELARVKLAQLTRKNGDLWLKGLATKEGCNDVGLTFSAPVVLKWLSVHPDPRPGQYLFCAKKINGQGYGMWTHSAMSRALRDGWKRAGIDKPFKLHAFRSSGACFWKFVVKVEDQDVENRGNWARGSRALRESYLVVAPEQSHERAKARLAGRPVASEEVRLQVQTCPKCQWPNEPKIKFCSNCHHQLSMAANAKEKSRISLLEERVVRLQEELDDRITAAIQARTRALVQAEKIGKKHPKI